MDPMGIHPAVVPARAVLPPTLTSCSWLRRTRRKPETDETDSVSPVSVVSVRYGDRHRNRYADRYDHKLVTVHYDHEFVT